jgi:dipeptidyl aminopeptidase/acylaminoacyl peptidase
MLDQTTLNMTLDLAVSAHPRRLRACPTAADRRRETYLTIDPALQKDPAAPRANGRAYGEMTAICFAWGRLAACAGLVAPLLACALMQRMHSRVVSLILASCLVSVAAPKRPIAETDLYAFRWIAAPQISPDSARIVYTLVTVNTKHDNYETQLWIVPASGSGAARQLTSGPHDSTPRWSPDGRTLAFLRAPEQKEKDAKPQPAQIYLLSMDGGEARPLTDIPKGASGLAWAPGGHSIAFLSTTLPKDLDKKLDKKKDDKDEAESDVRVIVKAAYRMNGEGYYEPGRPTHIWTVPVPATLTSAQKATPVTTGDFSESDLAWSRDGARIYFTSNRVREPYYEPPHDEIYAVKPAGGDVAKVAAIDGSIHAISLSPDGSHIAFVGSINSGGGLPQRSYSQPDLFIASTEPGGTRRNLTAAYDYDISGGVGGDQAPPRGSGPSPPYWSADGRGVFVDSAAEGRANLQRIDAETGKVEALTSGDQNVYSYSATPDGSKAAVLISTPTNIGDLYLLDAASGRLDRLTHINDDLFATLNLAEPETIWYQSFDGRRIQAWVQRPPDFNPAKKYPLILDIHGGPHAAYGYTFDHEFQWMAAKGYIVLYPNPRGSTSYGQEFGNIIQYAYPGDDFKDLMAGVDELIARGWVDPAKLGVTGGSGGGVLTNWTVGHTTRFKAAVSQRSIADWRDFWYTADFTLFTPFWFRGAPWEQEADFKERSPITYVDKIATPLMLIEGEADFRTPPGAGGEQMFRALKYQHKTAVMVRFPGESHELSRSGKPVHRVERLQHIVAWFDKYLEGQDIHTYDIN